MPTTQTTSWLNNFLQEQQRVNAARDQQYNAVIPAARAANAIQTRPTVGGILTTPGQTYAPVPLDDVSGGPSVLSRVFDVLERPLYGAANLATDVVREFKGENSNRSAVDSVLAGITGKEKSTYIDTLKEAGLPNILANTLGTVANLGLDPANLTLGLAGKGVVAGIRGLTGSAKALKDAEEFKNIAEANKPDFVGTPETPPLSGPTGPVLPRAEITAGTPEPDTYSVNSQGIADNLSRNISKDDIHSALQDVNSRTYQVGNITSPYKDYSELENAITLARRNPSAQQAFAARYKTILDPKDYAALQRVRSPEAFDEVATNILKKTKPAGINSMNDFLYAVKHGDIPQDEVNKVLDATLSEDVPHLLNRYEAAGGVTDEPIGTTDARNTPQATTAGMPEQPSGAATTGGPQTAQEPLAGMPVGAGVPSQELNSPLGVSPSQVRESANIAASDPSPVVAEDKKINVVGQGQRTTNNTYKIVQDVKNEYGISATPAKQISEVARRLYLQTAVEDTAERAAGHTHPVRAYDRTNASTDILPGREYPSLRMSDVMQTLGQEGVKKSFVDFKTRLRPSIMLRMAARTMDGFNAGLDEFATAQRTAEAGRYWNNVLGGSYKSGRTQATVEAQINAVASHLAKNAERLTRNVNESLRLQNAVVARAAGVVVNNVETKIAHAISPVTGTRAAAIDALSDVGGMTSKAAQGNEAVANAAAPVVAEDVARFANEGDTRAAQTAKANEKAIQNEDPVKAQRETVNNAVKQAVGDAADARVEALSVMPADLSPMEAADVQAANELQRIAEKKYAPVSSLLGTFGRKGRDIAQDAVHGRSAAVTSDLEFNNDIAAMAKKYDVETHRVAFNALQSGQWPEQTSQAYAAAQELRRFLDVAGADTSHMDGGVGAPLTGTFGRDYTTADIHRYWKEAGIPDEQIKMSEKKLEELKAKNPNASMRAILADSWRHVTIDNPIDFISRLNGAARNMAISTSVGTHFAERYGSLVRKEGYIRLPDQMNVPGGSRFNQYVPKVDKQGRTIYYPREAAEWLAHTENTVAHATGATKARGPIARFIQKDLDPILQIWKTTVTVARPGFISKNFIGDVFLNYMAGIYGVKAYKDALQVMKAGGRLKDRTIEKIDQLLTDPSDATAVGTWKGTVHLKNGKTQVLNDSAMYNLAYQNGVPVSYLTAADVITAKASKPGETLSLAQRANDRVNSTKYIQTMSRYTEEASHIPRMAQFVHHMQDPKFTARFRTLDEAAQAATVQVRKFHPDLSDLSTSGQRTMRRIMPFYSWSRLVIPTVLESLLTRPTTITALPKVLFGVNQMVGGGAASPTELFPPTRLLPSFVRDTLGYAGGNFTFNLGTPAEGLADLFNGNPVKNLYGMLNPAIKAPIDLLSGTRQETGAGIPDKGEYVDQLVPGFGQIASITGISPSGSIANMVTGNGLLDPQRAVQQGEKKYFINQGTLNFLAGLGINNFSRGSFDTIAQRQYRGGGG